MEQAVAGFFPGAARSDAAGFLSPGAASRAAGLLRTGKACSSAKWGSFADSSGFVPCVLRSSSSATATAFLYSAASSRAAWVISNGEAAFVPTDASSHAACAFSNRTASSSSPTSSCCSATLSSSGGFLYIGASTHASGLLSGSAPSSSAKGCPFANSGPFIPCVMRSSSGAEAAFFSSNAASSCAACVLCTAATDSSVKESPCCFVLVPCDAHLPTTGDAAYICTATASHEPGVLTTGAATSSGTPTAGDLCLVAILSCFVCTSAANSSSEEARGVAAGSVEKVAEGVARSSSPAASPVPNTCCVVPCVVRAASATEASLFSMGASSRAAGVLFTGAESSSTTTSPIPNTCCVIPCVVRSASATDASLFSMGASSRAAEILFTGAEGSSAMGSNLPKSCCCLLFSCAAGSSSAHAPAYLRLITGALGNHSSKVAGGSPVKKSPAKESLMCFLLFPSLSGQALPVASSFLSCADSWQKKARSRRLGTRCSATKRDDMRSTSLEDWQRITKVALLCILLQKSGYLELPSIRPSSQPVQAPEMNLKKAMCSMLLVCCLLIGYQSAKGDEKMSFLVKVFDGTMKAYKIVDEVSKIIFK